MRVNAKVQAVVGLGADVNRERPFELSQCREGPASDPLGLQRRPLDLWLSHSLPPGGVIPFPKSWSKADCSRARASGSEIKIPSSRFFSREVGERFSDPT